MIELESVTVGYGERTVLRNVNLRLTERRIGIVGRNGSGKSTFARLLNGLLIPNQGQVVVDGLNTRSQGKAIRRLVGFVFQNPDNQIVFPIVEEDIAFGLKNLGFNAERIDPAVDQILDRYGLLDHRTHPSHLLSGGQKQLLAIAGVLVMDPKYIVFDEPTTLLDLFHKRQVCHAIAELDQTVIIATHDLETLAEFDRVIVFEDTRIVADDEPAPALRYYTEMMANV